MTYSEGTHRGDGNLRVSHHDAQPPLSPSHGPLTGSEPVPFTSHEAGRSSPRPQGVGAKECRSCSYGWTRNRHERPRPHGTRRHCTRVMPRASNAYAYPYAHCGLNPHPSVTGASSPLPHARSGPKGDRRHAAPLPPLLQAGRSEGVPRQVQEARLVASSLNKQNPSRPGSEATSSGQP